MDSLSLGCADLRRCAPLMFGWGCRFLIVTPYRSAPTGWARIQWEGTLRAERAGNPAFSRIFSKITLFNP